MAHPRTTHAHPKSDEEPTMADRDARERDILIAANEYAYVQDLTKGDIVLYCGPTKISLSNTERIVEYKAGRFVPIRADEGSWGVNPFVSATSAQYVVLENPPKDSTAKPTKGNNSAIELLNGRRVVIPGPATFPLWPGQKAEVIDAHKLREDQYLVVRVYDRIDGDPSPIGTEKIVKGSEVSFYTPKTGLEVVPEKGPSTSPGQAAYVRTAVTLLDGEYAILLTPTGHWKYVRGPGIVFPEPMEEFVQKSGVKAFKAWHMRRGVGLHVRVLRDFDAKDGEQVPAGHYHAGQELFLKDREGFFFPTASVEPVGEVRPVPIHDKEGIYVRDIETGKITTEIGPKNYLADPTHFEVIQRTLDPEVATLYGLPVHDPARAISVYIPPSFAVLVTAKDRREVVKGPRTRILAYDEDLEVLTLSTGKPKSDEVLLKTCFLQTDGNKVSDIVRVKTSDHVELDVRLSYRVSFVVAESEKWFNVKNYVALLCDHLGSIVRAAVRATRIEDFHARSTEVIRDVLLGGKKDGGREGRRFAENGMCVYDVEVLEVKILDEDVKKLLADAQRTAIVSELGKKSQGFRLEDEKIKEKVNQEVYEARKHTLAKERELELAKRELSEARVGAAVEADKLERVGKAQNEAAALDILAGARAAAAEKQVLVDNKALAARVDAFKDEMAALSPELVATLKTLGAQYANAELHQEPLAARHPRRHQRRRGDGAAAQVAPHRRRRKPRGARCRQAAAGEEVGLRASGLRDFGTSGELTGDNAGNALENLYPRLDPKPEARSPKPLLGRGRPRGYPRLRPLRGLPARSSEEPSLGRSEKWRRESFWREPVSRW
ncbi:MAG: hypothetical protein QM765_47715 [Myxococcales bacterium]